MTTIKDFKDVDDTIIHIIAMIKKHSGDPILDNLEKTTLQNLFDFISKEIRYLKDPQRVSYLGGANIELLRSPRQTLVAMAGDCDCKTILSGAIFHKKKLPFRIAITSEREDKKFHHVYPELLLGGKETVINVMPFDATYPENRLGKERSYTAKRVYYEMPQGIIAETIL